MLRKTFIDLDTDSDEDQPLTLVNVYVTGYSKTGKTSIVKRISMNVFNLVERPTKCIEIYNKIKRGNFVFKLWDVPYHLFHTIKPTVNDVVLYVVGDVVPPLPTYPARIWVVGRHKIDTHMRFVRVDAMANTGIRTLLRHIINDF
jgi:hypothetical protein